MMKPRADREKPEDAGREYGLPAHRGYHNPFLHGNGVWCSTCCDGRAPNDTDAPAGKPGCNECGGHGRVPFSAETIVANIKRKRKRK